MSALPLPKYSIDKLQLFKQFTSCAEYFAATGEVAPPFDNTRPPKFWFDPKARQSTRMNMIYENVIALGANGLPIPGPDGKPFTEPMVLKREEAATVNMAGDDTGNVPGMGATPVPVPLRALDADEELAFEFGGTVSVHNKTLYAEAFPEGYGKQDRALLQAIAKKLGVV